MQVWTIPPNWPSSSASKSLRHNKNRGYGGNQKTCYTAALARGADIVVMLHPDYQYTPKLVTAMASMIASEQFDAVLASRILGNGALAGGMPLYKSIANRFLILFQNLLVGYKLSEYRTGYRAWSRTLLEKLPLMKSSDDFVFDNQMIVQSLYFGSRLGKSPARQITFQKLHRSISSAASFTDWAC